MAAACKEGCGAVSGGDGTLYCGVRQIQQRPVRKMLEEKHLPIKRAIICCQAFHARRCRMYFEYVFRDREIEFLMCPAVTQSISRDNWTESKKGLETVLGELRRCGEQFSWMLQ